MDLFGNNFLTIRNNHLLPRISYGVLRNKYEFWSLKDVFTTKIISLNKLSGKSYEIELSKEDYYKSIHCDIELFMNKVEVQYADFLSNSKISASWSFITFYYFAFFNVTCLFRFIDKGFIFLSREQCKRIEEFSVARYSAPISVTTGNYYFALKEINNYGNVVIILSHKGENVHKSTWLQLESTLREFLNTSDELEKDLIHLFLNHFTQFESSFPSNLRNKLNYNGSSCLLDFNSVIPYISLKELNKDFKTNLIKLDISVTTNFNQMESISYLTSFIFEFNKKLQNEYRSRSSYGKDFETERKKYLKHRAS